MVERFVSRVTCLGLSRVMRVPRRQWARFVIDCFVFVCLSRLPRFAPSNEKSYFVSLSLGGMATAAQVVVVVVVVLRSVEARGRDPRREYHVTRATGTAAHHRVRVHSASIYTTRSPREDDNIKGRKSPQARGVPNMVPKPRSVPLP